MVDEALNLEINRVDALDRPDIALAGRIFESQRPFDIELHRFGIERRAVVEDDVRPQLQGDGQAVFGDGPVGDELF